MAQILAALIISCSNLVDPLNSKINSAQEILDSKVKCIKRVSECGKGTLLTKDLLEAYKAALNCSKEVYL